MFGALDDRDGLRVILNERCIAMSVLRFLESLGLCIGDGGKDVDCFDFCSVGADEPDDGGVAVDAFDPIGTGVATI